MVMKRKKNNEKVKEKNTLKPSCPLDSHPCMEHPNKSLYHLGQKGFKQINQKAKERKQRCINLTFRKGAAQMQEQREKQEQPAQKWWHRR